MSVPLPGETPEQREFDLASVLTITTGRLLVEIGKVYKILSFMTGDSLMTHQLPRASDACQPALLGQHPELIDVPTPDVHSMAEAHAFVAEQAKRFGATLSVTALEWWVPRNPLAELADIAGDKPIIVVQT